MKLKILLALTIFCFSLFNVSAYYSEFITHTNETMHECVDIYDNIFGALNEGFYSWCKDNVTDIVEEESNPEFLEVIGLNMSLYLNKTSTDYGIVFATNDSEEKINWTESDVSAEQLRYEFLSDVENFDIGSLGVYTDYNITSSGFRYGNWAGDKWMSIVFALNTSFSETQDNVENLETLKIGNPVDINIQTAEFDSDEAPNYPKITYELFYANCTINPSADSYIDCECTYDSEQTTTGNIYVNPPRGQDGNIYFNAGLNSKNIYVNRDGSGKTCTIWRK